MERWRGRQADRRMDRLTEERKTETEREKERKTDRRTDGMTERLTDDRRREVRALRASAAVSALHPHHVIRPSSGPALAQLWG